MGHFFWAIREETKQLPAANNKDVLLAPLHSRLTYQTRAKRSLDNPTVFVAVWIAVTLEARKHMKSHEICAFLA